MKWLSFLVFAAQAMQATTISEKRFSNQMKLFRLFITIRNTLAWIGARSSDFFHDSGSCNAPFVVPLPNVKTSSHCSNVNDDNKRKFCELILLWSALRMNDDSASGSDETVKIIFTLLTSSNGSQLMSFISNILSTESIKMTTWCFDFSIECCNSAAYDSIVCYKLNN